MTQLPTPIQHETLPLDRIEEELTHVLQSFREPGELVHRARMSNLVIFCDDADRVDEIQELIPKIVAVHPARVILALHGSTEKEGPVTGSVTAWCSVGEEKAKICSEQVTLYSSGKTADHLIFAVRGLITGDLPTNLWWASPTPPALAGSILNEAAEHAQQIIYDSIGWVDPARGVAATGAWVGSMERSLSRGQWRVFSDVNWRRLKFWRRILTQTLDPNVLPGALDSIAEIEVAHGPHAVVQAWLLVGWLASRLGWSVTEGHMRPGVDISWTVQAPHGSLVVCIDRLPDGPSEVRQVRVRHNAGGKPGVLTVSADGGDRLSVVLEGEEASARTLAIRPQPLDELIARQLSDRERDSVFRDSISFAETFARSVMR